MTEEVKELLARQARWQKGLKALSWPEKVRMAERVRLAVERLRASGPGNRKPRGQ